MELERDQADLVISPAIKTIKQLGFRDRDWLIESGAQAAEKALPALRAAFAALSIDQTVREPIKITRTDAIEKLLP